MNRALATLAAVAALAATRAAAQGAPQVNESTGDLVYSYAFELPRARGRWQPQLSLTYSSASAQDVGFGIGWSLSVPYVERDTRASPGLSVVWISLGGERKLLMPYAGKLRPAVEDGFLEVTPQTTTVMMGGTPVTGTTYTARDGSGTTFTFGRLFGNRAWLTRVTDLDGNVVEYEYAESIENPISIRYNLVPNSTTLFSTKIALEWRSDLPGVPAAAGGPLARAGAAPTYLADRKLRLDRVKVIGLAHTSGTVVRTYQLSYETGGTTGAIALAAVAEHGGDPGVVSGGPPPRTTRFGYSWGNFTLDPPIELPAPSMPAGVTGSGLRGGRWLDLDGDGLTDLVWPYWRVWTPNVTPPGSPSPVFGVATAIPLPAGVPQSPLSLRDYDGDGLQDFVRAFRDSSGNAIHRVHRGIRSGPGSFRFDDAGIDVNVQAFFGLNESLGQPLVDPISPEYLLADLNGDGVLDYAVGQGGSGCGKPGAPDCSWRYGFTRFDLVGRTAEVVPQTARAHVLPGTYWFRTAVTEVWLSLDVNGDGLADAVWVDNRDWHVSLNLGAVNPSGGLVMYRDEDVVWGSARPPGHPLVQVESVTFPYACDPQTFLDPRVGYTALLDLDGDGRPESVEGATTVHWNHRNRPDAGEVVLGAGFLQGTAVPNAPDWAEYGDDAWFTWRDYTLSPDGTQRTDYDCESAILPGYGHGLYVDMTGDGIPDFVRAASTTPPSPLWFWLGRNGLGLGRPVVLSTVTTFAGAQYAVEYAPSTLYGVPARARRPIVTRVSFSGPQLQPSGTRYWYSNPLSGPQFWDGAKMEERGFETSWSQDETTKLVRRTTWASRSHALSGRPAEIVTGMPTPRALAAAGSLTSAGMPPGNLVFASAQGFAYGFKRLGDGIGSLCVGSPTDEPRGNYPLRVVARGNTTKTYLDALEILAGSVTTAIACGDVDANGNVLKATTSSVLGTTTGAILVTRQSFTGSTSCAGVPATLVTWKEDGSGTKLGEETRTFDSGCRVTEHWSPGTATAKTNRVLYSYAGPFRQVDAVTGGGVIKRTTYDPALGLHVTEERTDPDPAAVSPGTGTYGATALVTRYTYDLVTGLRLSAEGPLALSATGSAQTGIIRHYAYDLFGRQTAVTTGAPSGGQLVGAVEFTEYLDDAAPRAVASYRFAVRRTFTPSNATERANALDALDTMKSVAYLDGLGRVIQIRERLGGPKPGAAGARLASGTGHALTAGVKVSKAVLLDGAGREQVSAEPFYASSMAFVDYRANTFPPGKGTVTTYDDDRASIVRPRGAPWCVSLEYIGGRIPAPLGPHQACTSSSAHDSSFALRTESRLRWWPSTGDPAPNRGPYGGSFLATEVIPPDQNVTGANGKGRISLAGPAGEELGSVDGDGNYTWISRDAMGREVGSWREAGPGATYVKTPEPASSVAYNYAGQVIRTWDANLPTVQRESSYDEQGRLTFVKLDGSTGNGIEYLYGAGGLGRVTAVNEVRYVSGSATRTTVARNYYDFAYGNNVAELTFLAGKLAWTENDHTTIAYSYDDAGRVNRRDQYFKKLDGTKRFTVNSDYGADGRVLESRVVNDFGIATYRYNVDYDSAGRPVALKGGYLTATSQNTVYEAAVTQGSGGAYDALGRVPAMKADDGRVISVRVFDAYSGALRGECKQFGTGAACVSTVDATKDFFRTDKEYAQYQGSKLKSFREYFTPTAYTDFQTTYLPSGRVVETRATPSATVHSLTQSWSERFTYNGIGNIESVKVKRNTGTKDVSSDESYTPAGSTNALLDRVTSISALKPLDASPTATVGKSASTTTYAYDLLGHLTGVSRSPGESETLYYAPGGELLYRQIGTKFVFYAGEYATVTATGSGGVPQASSVIVDAHVVFAGTRIASTSPARTLFYYRSRLGSVVATSLAGGVRGASYRYTPYGELDIAANETDATRSELGYTNALRLTGALLHLKNRVYDTETRLFIQADVVDRLRYAYVAGDPINSSDPTGLQATSDEAAAGATRLETSADGRIGYVWGVDSDGSWKVVDVLFLEVPSQAEQFNQIAAGLQKEQLSAPGVGDRIAAKWSALKSWISGADAKARDAARAEGAAVTQKYTSFMDRSGSDDTTAERNADRNAQAGTVGADGGETLYEGGKDVVVNYGAGKVLGAVVGTIAKDANKLRHIFRPKHNLDGVVKAFGSEEAAARAIERAAQRYVTAAETTGEFVAAVPVGGHVVTVRGVAIDGVARVGTAWVP